MATIPIVLGALADRPDEDDTAEVAAAVAAALGRLGHATETVTLELDFRVLEAIARRRPLAVFNLVEAIRGDGRLAQAALHTMEHLGLPVTGCGAEALIRSNSKLLAKEALAARGLPTPRWWAKGTDVPADVRVIVKPVDEHASIGIDTGSVVAGADAAATIAERESRFGLAFFAEAFVDGREFNIAVIEKDGAPRVLPLAEMTFDGLPAGRPRIVDYEAKWARGTPAFELTLRRYGCERDAPDLARRLSELSRACWHAFGLRGYARIDFRVGDDGAPAIIDVNTNPCLAADAGFMAAAAEAGMTFDDVVGAIVASAAARMPTPAADDLRWRDAVMADDVERIRRLVAATDMFTSAESGIAAELVEERVAKGRLSGYEFILAEDEGGIVGYACYGPTPGTDGTYDLYWIVVAPSAQGRGLGRRILARVEQAASAAGGTALYIDTSSTEKYAPTRAFYRRTGFRKLADLPDFYRAGDGKIIMRKVLRAANSA